jgi:hypothetical protein
MKMRIAAAAAVAGLGLCVAPGAVSAEMRDYSGVRVCTAEGCEDYRLVEGPSLTLLPDTLGRDLADTACRAALAVPQDAREVEELDAEVCTSEAGTRRWTSTLVRLGDVWVGAESTTAPGGVVGDNAVGVRADKASVWVVECSYESEVASSCR